MRLEVNHPVDLVNAVRKMRQADPEVDERLAPIQRQLLQELAFSAGSLRVGPVLRLLVAMGARLHIEMPEPAPSVSEDAAQSPSDSGQGTKSVAVVLTKRERDFLDYVRSRNSVETVRGRFYEELVDSGFLQLSCTQGRFGYVLSEKALEYFREGAPTLEDTDAYRRAEECGFTPTQLHWCMELREQGPLTHLPGATSQALMRKGFIEEVGPADKLAFRLTTLGHQQLQKANPGDN